MDSFVFPLQDLAAFDDIRENTKKPGGAVHIIGCVEQQKAHLIFGVCNSSIKLVITYNETRARELCEEYSFFDKDVVYYPAKDFIFYNADIHGNLIVKQRINAIKRIAEAKKNGSRLTVVTTIDGCLDKLLPYEYMLKNVVEINLGDEIDLNVLGRNLVKLGYERCAQVESGGQFAIRGGIVDVYPFTEETPFRMELFGDEVDSIRSFDAESQRSIENVDSVQIYPASELIFDSGDIFAALKKIKADTKKQEEKFKAFGKLSEAARIVNIYNELDDRLRLDPNGVNGTMGIESYINYLSDDTVSFLDYFDPDDTMVAYDEPNRIADKLKSVNFEFNESMSHRLEKGNILPGQADVLFNSGAIFARLGKMRLIVMSVLDVKVSDIKLSGKYDVGAKGISSYNNSFETLTADISKYRKNGYSIVLVSSSKTRAERLAADLRDNELIAYYSDGHDRKLLPGEIMTTYGNLRKGFEYPGIKFVVIAESDIFTAKKKQNKRKKSTYTGKDISSFSELSIGDYVVHENYGLGIYRGIEKLVVEKVEKDYIKIEYGGGSALYVLATQLDVIQKYAGPDAKVPKLNKLGGTEWNKTKTRVKTAVAGIAKELVALYAARQAKQGFRFSEDTVWQKEFEEMFPYEETEDQLLAIEDTKRDMESSKIMDRLICGDVGFGKTEVAIRAAFKAVQDGKQVVYLVPTTILAQQHYNTFVQRMQEFGVRVDLLSRFCTSKQINKTLTDLKKGLVDVVIGTHRVLSKDVLFKDLGLLIIDEEQRFGVTHKEKIKQMKENLDVMTLTATPIPRTLHMSLVGIRDMSVLTEAPVDRMPIQTFVTEYDEELVREAIVRELSRGGQVYYVYNMVKGIEDVTSKIAGLVPDANVAFAHGQMNEHQLEKIMFDFINGDIDVLVSTTIIETGLDIPNTNTIIIHNADKFGLSQLYQLRGRVGRSNRTAYAFLLYKKDRLLKEEAEKRLSAIKEFTELGSGFKIAMKDLEIRGAGNVLGAEQHGHMEAVGYDMYCKLLNEAVSALKGESAAESFETLVEINMDAFIPSTYIKSEAQKLDIYKRIAAIENDEEYEELFDELMDRFGDLPKSAVNLMRIALLKSKAHKADITEIKATDKTATLRMYNKARLDVARIPELIQKYKGRMKLKPENSPVFIYMPIADELKNADRCLETVSGIVDDICCITLNESV